VNQIYVTATHWHCNFGIPHDCINTQNAAVVTQQLYWMVHIHKLRLYFRKLGYTK